MSPAIASTAACFAILLGLGLLERLARDRAWRRIPVRVHVNGTRGKSTVTRLIWSALREAGVPAVAKTTGTAPRLLCPDGTERPIVRRSPANIREQLALLRTATRLGARAVVVECMALDPELQWVSERHMVRATVGVVTNVREDHVEIMGQTETEIAATLANTAPRAGVLVLGEDRALSVFETQARRVGSRIVRASQLPSISRPVDSGRPAWLEENYRTALAVTRELGIADEVALRGFDRAPADPGAARQGRATIGGCLVEWLDASAANDPESLDALGDAPDLLVYNHRSDRAVRLESFARHSRVFGSAKRLVLTGDRPAVTQWPAISGIHGARPAEFVSMSRLAARVAELVQGHSAERLVFGGNTRGLHVEAVVAQAEAGIHD